MSDAKAFLQQLTELFGQETSIHSVETSQPRLPPVHCFFFEGLPDDGMLTCVTYGISCADHPDWVNASSELIVTLETNDKAWAMGAAAVAEAARGKHSLEYGSVLSLNKTITPDTRMDSYVFFASAILSREQSMLPMPRKPIYLRGAYPVYPGEKGLIGQIGLHDFWHNELFDPLSVERPDLSAS